MNEFVNTRRAFIKNSAVGIMGAATILSVPVTSRAAAGTPAILGGPPVRKGGWPRWPEAHPEGVARIQEVLDGTKWTRINNKLVIEFEKELEKLLDVKHAVATTSGTAALHCGLSAVGVGPGDEVIVTPYQFITGASIPFCNYALPIFVDVDRETFQIDADKIEEKITEHTKAIIPSQWGGAPADMDKIMSLAKKYNLSVIEDACHALLSEWRGRKVGTIGQVGCFSHQQSKTLVCGEGGSMVGNDTAVMERCYSWHDYGRDIRDWESHKPARGFPHVGLNYKMIEIQAALLLSHMKLIKSEAGKRADNGAYLNQLLDAIPGMASQKQYPGTTRVVYRTYCCRYDKAHFHDLPRANFVKALRAEGIPMSEGMQSGLHEEKYFLEAVNSPVYKSLYSSERLQQFRKQQHYPETDTLCKEEHIWFGGQNLLGSRSDMESIAEAITKIQVHAAKLL